MSEQIAFDLRPEPEASFDNFIPAHSHKPLLRWLSDPRLWTGPILIIHGPQAYGKTHLCQAFCQAHKGLYLQSGLPIRAKQCRGRVIGLDDAHSWSEESLFILCNMALSGDIPALLLTDRRAAKDWEIALPDLRSRISNVMQIEIEPLDDDALGPFIRKSFYDYGREIEKSVVDYILIHAPRDIQNLRRLIHTIEGQARSLNKDVTKRFVAKCLRDD